MTAPELKPCPFCGKLPEQIFEENYDVAILHKCDLFDISHCWENVWNSAWCHKEIASLRKQLKEFRESEKKLSDAYLRIRSLVNSFDTPNAPTPEQIYELTERKICELIRRPEIELEALLEQCEKMAQALEHCRNRPHEHNPPDTFIMTHCEIIGDALQSWEEFKGKMK